MTWGAPGPSRPLCGKWMPKAREYCARKPGHADHCRSRYALDNNRDARWYGVSL